VAQLYSQAPSTHFSRLLRHAWVTVGLFFSPVATRGHNTKNDNNIKTSGIDGHKGKVVSVPKQAPRHEDVSTGEVEV